MEISRRTFLRTGFFATLAASIPASASLFVSRALGAPAALGTLMADPDGVLDLPMGFSYSTLERSGDFMDDGYVVPQRPDGMVSCTADLSQSRPG